MVADYYAPLTIETAQARIDAVRPGFQVLEITGQTKKRKIILLHQECGNKFETDLYSFKKSGGKCKICKN